MCKEFAYGADFGWVSQLEEEGVTWVDECGNRTEPVREAVRMGLNAVRLRVFVDPPSESYWAKTSDEKCMLGFCDKESVLKMAGRVKEAGLKLMIDFHYSDHFADPQYQDIPERWKEEDLAGLKDRVAEHTVEVLELLREHGITPDWVQVGNEINKGFLWPEGKLDKNPGQMTVLLNAGYDAVKSVFAGCPVIIHMSGLPHGELYQTFLEEFFSRGGKTDILGFSYYPYWYRLMFQEKDGEYDKERLYRELKRITDAYGKPVMIVEIGESEKEPEKCKEMLRYAVEALQELPEELGSGIFYWEPEVGAGLLPDHYPLGAAELVGDKVLRFTDALKGYFE